MATLVRKKSATTESGGKRTPVPRRPNRRKQVFTAAASLFLERGFDASTVNQIAQGSGLSVSGLYYHYESKQALLAAIVNYGLDLMDGTREKTISHSMDNEDRLRYLAHEFALAMTRTDYAQFTLVSIEETISLLPEDRAEILRRRRSHIDFIRGILDGLKAEGKLCNVDTTTATFTLLGMMLWIVKWYQAGGRLTGEEVADDVTRLVMRCFVQPGSTVGTLRDIDERTRSPR